MRRVRLPWGELEIRRPSALGWLAVSLIVSLTTGCTPSGGDASDPIGLTRSAIIGGDSMDVTASQALPARGVGWITNIEDPAVSRFLLAGRPCTATPILRDVVLTAGHCLCKDKNLFVPPELVVFHLNHIDPATGALVDVGPNGQGIPASRIEVDTLYCDPFETVIEPANYVPKDLAIVVLSAPLSVADLPAINSVYTMSDLYDRVFNRPEDEGFFGGPVQGVGWNGSVPFTPPAVPVKKMATVNEIIFDRSKVFQGGIICLGDVICSNNGPGYWLHDDIDTVIPANRLLFQAGDSGGPLTFRQNGTTPTIFGVMSIASQGLANLFGPFNSWSPTWDNNGLKGGEFIRQFITGVDADGDGVSDENDNCSPPRCDSHATCFNPNQDDQDTDGIGDSCDKCPPFMCTRRGLPESFCRDPAQQDFDNDGVGNVCDLCPTTRTPEFEGDRNNDGVGNTCDNCSDAPFGGRLACRDSNDCPFGVCVTTDVNGGRCADGSNRSCNTFNGFVCTACVEIGVWGFCSEGPEPDTDRDTIGNRCDTCPLFDDLKLQQNSNTHAEREVAASVRNDACDSIPLFSSRTVLFPFNPNAPEPAQTLFTSFAGVGSDTNVPHAPYNTGAPVGFRHCDCDPDVSEIACMNACGTSREQFDASESLWMKVTIGVTPPSVYDRAQISPPVLDLRLTNLIYTSGFDCSDPFPHQGSVSIGNQDKNLCRLGSGTGRIVAWSTALDIDQGRVASFMAPPVPISGEPQIPNIVRQTDGMFWSHGILEDPISFAGLRDFNFQGGLRDNYVRVKTPAVSFDLRDIPRLVPATPLSCAFNPQCWQLLSTDWIKALINPGLGINIFRTLPRPFIIYPNCDSTGALCGIRRSTEPHIDLGLGITNDARFALGNANRFLVTPVDPYTSNTTFAGGVMAVSVPRSWQQLSSDIQGIGVNFAGQLDTIQVFQASNESLPENVIPFSGQRYVPSNREGARWLFSKVEQALYMIGGARGSAPTSEIWRLDLTGAAWKHLFKEGVNPQVGVGTVAAAAYDSAAGKLLVVDNAPGSGTRNRRIVVLDTVSDTSKVSALLDLRSFTKVGLTATGGGTYVLVGAKQTSWTAYRFQISAQNTITWLGKKTGQGLVVADPLPWQEGPGLFFQKGSDFDTVDLVPTAFTPSGTPPELGVCDKPLVVPPPAPIVITKCHSPTLQAPTPTSACGPVTVDLKGAPIDFPLGTRTITWILTDALGNSVSVPQTVTAILGDDSSCCPAGTNIIMGTSNNDNLTGTSGADCILALGAQDTVNGGGGNDYISGGEGDDVLNGGLGNDQIYGGGGQDVISGNDGNDQLSGGPGDDQCFGGRGDDLISGGDGQDRLFGDDGTDQLFGDTGDDRLSGGAGNDVLDGGLGHNACSGGTGTNQFLRCESFF